MHMGWLDRRAAPHQRDLQAAAFVFVDKILLPLFLREKGWTAKPAPAVPVAHDSAAAVAEAASPIASWSPPDQSPAPVGVAPV